MPKRKTYIVDGYHRADSLAGRIKKYLNHLKICNFAEGTIKGLKTNFEYFVNWCHKQKITRPEDITIDVIEKYQRHLINYKKLNGDNLTFRTRWDRISALRNFFKWMVTNRYMIYNPTADIVLKKRERTLPRQILTGIEAERILWQPDINSSLGIRDRAILETLYSTGMRRKEITRLSLQDLDFDRETIIVRQGKWRKDRTVPIGEKALHWLKKYIIEIRPSLTKDETNTIIFLTRMGKAFSPSSLTYLAHQYIKRAKINKNGACHIFRHTMATLMLENGADIRYIQELLGHSQLSTTQVYTRVSIKKLKEIHTLTHPAR